MKYYLSALLILSAALFSFAQTFSFLDIERTGAASFIKQHPDYNGKGVVIIILDTGVDMGTPGLTALPDGSPKVIDAQDFSGEGDVFLKKAKTGHDEQGNFVDDEGDLRLFAYDKLKYQPKDSVYYIGMLDESRFKNTILPDINNNDKKDDRFGVIVMNTKDGWLAYVDLDGDGNLDDESPLWNYKEKLQAFHFKGRNPEQNSNLATFALNIFPDEKRVNFHYDGSSHATHVAGMAAGYKINGQEGFNGIAPGAKIISLKIGDCRLAGGATTTGSMVKAYEYGINFAKQYDGPVVFNMSFGIGSEIEGQSDMDLTLDDFLTENENLLFCLSAGNEGPGISSIGLPAASKRALTVGALNTERTARDLYGASMKGDRIFVFSSRGGELNKPDILAPGGASSTVPGYSARDIKWGTSMASPEATGAVALVMSAAYQQKPPLPIVGALIKKAVKNAADPLPCYLPLEQGSGVINIPRAFEYYKYYIKNKEQDKILDYDISTLSPVYETEEGPAAYWRFGTYLPDKNDKQRFYINPVFPQKMTPDQKKNFYRAFSLKSTAPWIKLNKTSTYIKGQSPAAVDVYFDRSKLKKPGLYNGKVIAYHKGGFFSGAKARDKEFELMCTLVQPLTFNEANKFSYQSGRIKLTRGRVKRIFFEVPMQASAAALHYSIPNGRYGNVRAYLFDPQGRETEFYAHLYSEKRPEQTITISKSALSRGTWELDLYADFRNEEPSYVNVDIAFDGLVSKPQTIRYVHIENGSKPAGSVKIINQYDSKVQCKIGGIVNGIQKSEQIEDNSSSYEYAFSVGDNYEKVVFELSMEPEVFNMFTDFAVNVKDYSDKVLKADGFTTRKLKITFVPEKSGDYILEFVPGFAAKEPKDWQVNLKASYYLFKKLSITGPVESFYPGVPKEINFRIKDALPVAPDGYNVFGEVWLDSKKTYRRHTVIPMLIDTSLK